MSELSRGDADQPLTANGLHTLISDRTNSGSVVLRAQRTSFPEVFQVSDDATEILAILLPTARQKVLDAALGDADSVIMRVLGVVLSSSDKNVHESPFLEIADMEVVSVQQAPSQREGDKSWKWPNNNKASMKNQGGLCFHFFKEWTPFLSNDELAGSGAWNRTLFPVDTIKMNSEAVSAFLEQHAALQTLHRSHSNDESNSNNGTPAVNETNNMTGSYQAALKEFQNAQMDRQKATLQTNAGRETAQGATKILSQYKLALEMALSCPASEFLSVDLLCQWHKVLCGDGLHPEAGKLRRKNVHVGNTYFRGPELVRKDLEVVCTCLRTLESRLLQQQQTTTTSSTTKKDRGLAAATFAACVLLGILDIHGFADGNGRLARIVLNWALARAGVPFVVHLFATPAQRREYVTAIRRARRNITLQSKGQVTQDQLLDGYRAAGALLPLVDLILSRLSRTVTEFQKVVQEKRSQMSEEDESRAARKFRERAASGSCLICFEDNPNIATLCCGKAVHLNCMAEWLSAKNSCPQCRGDLPSLPARLRRGGDADTSQDGGEQEVADTSSTTSVTETTFDTYTDSDETGGPAAVAPAPFHEDTTTDDTTTEVEQEDTDDTTEVSAAEDTTTDETTDDSTEADVTTQQATRTDLPPFCSYEGCHNRSARDCDNMACGRCCMIHGQYSCSRHGC